MRHDAHTKPLPLVPAARSLHRDRLRRAVSLIEIVGVIALVGIVSLATYATLSGSARPGGDTAAKTSLVIFSELQTTSFVDTGAPADLTLLASRNPSLTWTSSFSTTPTEVHVINAGTATAAAVSTGDDSCWFIRLDAAPSAGGEPVIWAVADGVLCDASTAMALTPTGTPTGRNPNSPQILGVE